MPDLSVVISALNEERTVKSVLNGVLSAFDRLGIRGEIIFLNNHSTDRTGEFADGAATKDARVRIVHRSNRPDRDLGSSLREGLSNARGDWVMIMDCDLSHDPAEMNRLWEKRGKADIIIGSRFVKGGRGDMPLSRQMISKTYNFAVQILLGVRCRDITTGFKLYRRAVFDRLKLTNTGFGLHVEILLKAVRAGFTTFEVPIYYRPSGKSTLSYRRQFKNYVSPAIEAFIQRLFRRK